ncbi:MAG: CRTAC1 family protein [Phycisphaerales bacterium JB038]
MSRHSTPALLIALAGLSAISPAHAGDVVINGITFTDRSATGEIDLGFHTGGIAVFDYDNDGHPDIVLADNRSVANRLFHNEADPNDPSKRIFVNVTAGSGLDDAEGTSRRGKGIVTADYDNDGHTDIFIIGRLNSADDFGLLYRNNGDGTFSNVSSDAGVRISGYDPHSASWTDFDLDGYVDLFIASPRSSLKNFLLLRNNGDGTFSNADDRLPPAGDFDAAHVYSHTWFDYDGDGYDDCFTLANGNPGVAVVLHNIDDGAGGRAFVNSAPDIGFNVRNNGPMGITVGDLDGDADLDIAVTDFDEGRYYRNDGGLFTEIFPIIADWGWGNALFDVDNDRDLDYFMVGSVGRGAIENLLFENLGDGSFSDISPAVNGPLAASQHSVQIDFDTDGRTDFFVINPGTGALPLTVLHNESVSGNWAMVKLLGDGADVNRDAIGALVRLHTATGTQVRTVQSGTSTTATEDLRARFGLGADEEIDWIEVVWPRTGTLAERTQRFDGPFAPNQVLTFTSGVVIPGDLNGDGCVDQADLGILLAAYNTDDGGDLDGDGDTDQADLGILLGNYNAGC